MNYITRSLIAGLGLAVAATTGYSQLTGKVYADWDSPMLGDRGFSHTSITNTPTDSQFITGQAADASGPTKLTLLDSSFTNVGSGGVLAQDFLLIHNGYNKIGTTADHATADLMIDLPSLGVMGHYLTTLTVGINNTENLGTGTDDQYFVSFAPAPSHLDVGNMRIWFSLSFPGFDVAPGTAIAERGDGMTGLLTVRFTPIPEPSTYALMGASVLGLVILLRQRRKSTAQLAA
jgi:hypothetical protein